MAKYMVLYRSSTPPRDQMANLSPEQAKAGMEAWMTWAGKAGPSGWPIGGFSILEADSVDGVKKVLDDHPQLSMPGEASIEILEFLPVPGM